MDDDWGLAQNIELPTTGDEAIARLHNCRSRDAYSILGLRHDCTDEDIKRYYRRQAVLVHPDKNCTAGSDEAFKILAAAFELVSTVERREAYNAENLHRRNDVRQLHDLMQQLRTKMEEALSTMHCDCGVRHRRYPIAGRTQSMARYCARCDDRHAAKDNVSDASAFRTLSYRTSGRRRVYSASSGTTMCVSAARCMTSPNGLAARITN